jgi:chemotaxis protein histidine kinase CheA
MEDHHLYHDELFRIFHTLKARFGQFKQVEIIKKISDIEDILETKNYHKIKGAAKFLDKALKNLLKKHRTMVEACNKLIQDDGAVIGLSELNKKLEYINSIGELKDFLYHNYTLQDMKGFFQKFSYIIDHVSGQQGKSIDFVINGDEVKVDKSQYSDFLNVSIHLFRNMVDHGIESEDERIEKQKPQKGIIEVKVKLREKFMVILIEDDGRGIDAKRIKEKVLEKGLKTEEELKKIDPLELIFIPGLSTKDEVTEYSGRGVGMDAVKEEILKLKGNISVSSVVDEGTSFKIQLPLLK